MNHSWGKLRDVNFSAPERSGHDAFRGVATVYAYGGEDKRLMYGVAIRFDGLTRNQEAELMCSASGAVADALLKAAGFRGACRLSGATFLGSDLGAPIGDSGDIAAQKASFVRARR